MARKHRVQPADVCALQQKLMDELETLNANDESIERLANELTAYARHYQECARELRQPSHSNGHTLRRRC